jgi:DNA polymerase III subunit gamma/tau
MSFMSYVVLARKWRPMSFRDLIGQEHVSRTLANAIARDRVAHAFLFTGVRGVGKTTSARILAKALNCLQPQKEESGGVVPCLSCAACQEIAEGLDVDVREIDGASYTGVDEIRKLQESLPYRPTRDRYKIFIVDEVHMLSQNAWNALLKTLEEPPPHIKFILATTEVHKVPVTILSRVQRFDFKMIPSRLIGERIRYVLEQEQIEADDRAVALVAREAAGSMRDALSLLDQVIAFNPKQLVGDEVSRVLGIAGYSALCDIAEAVLAGDPSRALEGIADLTNQSCDLTVTARDLLGLLRDLVVAKLCKEPDALLDLSDDERRRVKTIAQKFDENDLLRVQRGFATAFDEIARSPEPRAALEMLLARLALRPPLVPVDELLSRLGEMEARLQGGKPPPGGGGGRPSPGPGGAGPRPGPRPVASASAEPAPPVARAASQQAPNAAPSPTPRAASVGTAFQSPPAPAPVERPLVAVPAPVPAAASAAATAPAAASVTGANSPAPAREVSPAAPQSATLSAGTAQAASPGAAPPSRPNPPAGGNGAALGAPRSEPSREASADTPAEEQLLRDWRRVLDVLGQSRPDLVAILKHTVPLGVGADVVKLGYEVGNVLEVPMRSPECSAALREAAATCFGREPKVVFEPVVGNMPTLAETDKRIREREKRAAVDRAERHPSVRDAVEILGARVKRIEVGDH